MIEACFRLADSLFFVIVVYDGEEWAALYRGAGCDQLSLEGSYKVADGVCVKLVQQPDWHVGTAQGHGAGGSDKQCSAREDGSSFSSGKCLESISVFWFEKSSDS